MNKCFLMGHLGGPAELKVTSGGASFLKFSIATTEKWKTAAGENKEKTNWHRCTYFSKGSDKLAQYLQKGTKLLVEGSIECTTVEKDGGKVTYTDIKVHNIEFADGKASSGGSKPAASSNDDSAYAPVAEEDLPF